MRKIEAHLSCVKAEKQSLNGILIEGLYTELEKVDEFDFVLLEAAEWSDMIIKRDRLLPLLEQVNIIRK